MVRAPSPSPSPSSHEKFGLKKGPWSTEEDRILRSYIDRNGHGNWRALPKAAGLARCGKSCRLRWMNYLRPDIKRGNFSWEEEETIIRLHADLGNKWSVIAARLPGRTDNEIKNIWHTHLKKKKKRLQSETTNAVNFDPSSPAQSNSSAVHATESFESSTETGESFWWDVLSGGEWSDFSGANNTATSSLDAEMDDHFWENVFCRADDFTHLFEDFL